MWLCQAHLQQLETCEGALTIMAEKNRMSLTEQQTVDSFLEVIQSALEVAEYEVALNTIENLKQLIVDKLMQQHYGRS